MRLLFTGIGIVLLFSRSDGAVAARPAIDCRRWTDSMIVAGIRMLKSGMPDSARQYFTAAYRCGMSRDSMYYFAAELYLSKGATDSAMTFNMALERRGNFDRRLYLEQRTRIFRALGMKRFADSVVARYSRSGRHDLIIDGTGSRSILSIHGLTLMPQRYTLDFPEDDIDDAGWVGVSYRWSRWDIVGLPKIMVRLGFHTELRIPTLYSFDEANDTLMRNVSFGIGVGEFPSTPEVSVHYRARIHDVNGDVDHFLKGLLTVAGIKKTMVSGVHETKLDSEGEIDDSRTEITLFASPLGRRIRSIVGVSALHHFSRSDFYQNLLDTAGLFRPLHLGFVDSLLPGLLYRYFRDYEQTEAYPLDVLPPDVNGYWTNQPRMALLKALPEHNLGMALRSSFKVSIPGGFTIHASGLLKLVGYTREVEWDSVDDPIELRSDQMDKQYAVIYCAADRKYYLTVNRDALRFNTSDLKELHHHREKRVDFFILVSPMLEKKFKIFGKVYISASYLKGFSTLDDDGPLARLDYMWQFLAGYQKDIFMVKK
ncbi:MAG: hypothetical protein JW913_16285 [Chitinispirillaceae bacterium]|nr:hypothetical protein [Chitinispirillaceae bacterium]